MADEVSEAESEEGDDGETEGRKEESNNKPMSKHESSQSRGSVSLMVLSIYRINFPLNMAPGAKTNFWRGAIFKSIEIPNLMSIFSSIY